MKAIDVKADFYVSTIGSDNWSGKLDEPNSLGTDGPFATLTHARDAVRELKEVHSEDILVLIRGGTYSLKETVVFGLEDSGKGNLVLLTPLTQKRRLCLVLGWKLRAGKK